MVHVLPPVSYCIANILHTGRIFSAFDQKSARQGAFSLLVTNSGPDGENILYVLVEAGDGVGDGAQLSARVHILVALHEDVLGRHVGGGVRRHEDLLVRGVQA